MQKFQKASCMSIFKALLHFQCYKKGRFLFTESFNYGMRKLSEIDFMLPLFELRKLYCLYAQWQNCTRSQINAPYFMFWSNIDFVYCLLFATIFASVIVARHCYDRSEDSIWSKCNMYSMLCVNRLSVLVFYWLSKCLISRTNSTKSWRDKDTRVHVQHQVSSASFYNELFGIMLLEKT